MLSDAAIARIVQVYGHDILQHEHMQLEKEALQHGNVTTYEHSIKVARLAVWIADRLHLWYRVDLASLVRAALLHDYFLYDWHEVGDGSHRLHGFRHPARALKNAREDFVLNHVIEDAIERHMFPLTPSPPRHIEGWIVNIADTLSAIRESVSLERFKLVRNLKK